LELPQLARPEIIYGYPCFHLFFFHFQARGKCWNPLGVFIMTLAALTKLCTNLEALTIVIVSAQREGGPREQIQKNNNKMKFAVFSWLWILVKLGLVVFGLPALAFVLYGLWDHFVFVSSREAKAKQLVTTPKDERGFSARKVSEQKYDVIVIGSGMGGLTTAALLARRGKRVLVLEQHDKLGGCTHTFEEAGFEFDTGLHYVGGEVGDKKSPIGFVFNLLSSGLLKWAKLDDCYDKAVLSPTLSEQNEQAANQNHSATVAQETSHNGNGNKSSKVPSRFSFVSDINKNKQNLIEQFPSQRKGIEDFYRLVGWAVISVGLWAVLKLLPTWIGKYFIRNTVGWLLLDPFVQTSTKDMVDSCIRTKSSKTLGPKGGDDDVAESCKGILGWCWGDYGTPPSLSPFLIHAMLVDHFSKGEIVRSHGRSLLFEYVLSYQGPIIQLADPPILLSHSSGSLRPRAERSWYAHQ
jgi:hypothetical protein